MKKRYLSILLILPLCLGLTIAALASGETEEKLLVEEPMPEDAIVEEAEPAQNGATIVDSGYCGIGLTWELDDEGTLTVSGTGEMDYTEPGKPLTLDPPWDNIREAVKKVVIEDGATSIGNSAFAQCTGLTSIEIPDSVTSIGGHAFWNCESLTSLCIPDGVTTIEYRAFAECASLSSVTLPNELSRIESLAFSDCTSLKSILIPANVTYIGDWAFRGCTSLSEIAIPDSVIEIGYHVFENCTKLRSAYIGAGLTHIPEMGYGMGGGMSPNFFAGCTKLISLSVSEYNPNFHSTNNCMIETESKTLVIGCAGSIIPADGSVTRIGEGAFFDSGLTTVTIPNSVTDIGRSAFSGCAGLTTVTIPNSMTGIDESVFSGCVRMKSVTIPLGITSIGKNAFHNDWGIVSVNNGGTESQWEAIDIDTGNEPLREASFEYGSGSLEIPPSDVQGDMDGDGVLTPNDAAIILRICSEG